MPYYPRTQEAALKITGAWEGAPPALTFEEVYKLTLDPRGIGTALGQAMLYDMAVQHGLRHDMVSTAEKALGVPFKSKVVENGASEAQLITRIAELRQERFPGSRAAFWLVLIKAGDWPLAGAGGKVTANDQPLDLGPLPVAAASGSAATVESITQAMQAASGTDEDERVRRAAFALTATFEGGGYATYQNEDKGIVSYGKHQFTLDSGSLGGVLEDYLNRAQGTGVAPQLAAFMNRVRDRSQHEGLRNDPQFKSLLIAAASEPAMRAAQDEMTIKNYWVRAHEISIKPRGLRLPLTRALIFDMAINHGVMHDMLGLAEKAVGLSGKTYLPDTSVREEDLITQLALIRQDRMNKLAEKWGYGGLKVRGDFWVKLVQSGDWQLQGNTSGEIEARPGRRVQVRNPPAE